MSDYLMLVQPPVDTSVAAVDACGPIPDVAMSELAAFVAVCEEASFTRAARRLHLSQSGISSRIMRLERAMGTQLLERTTRSVVVTAAGAQLLPVAMACVRNLAAVKRRVIEPRWSRAPQPCRPGGRADGRSSALHGRA